MGGEELDIRGIYALLRRRLKLIAVTFAGTIASAGIAIVALTPVYSSSALVVVDPVQDNLLDPETGITTSAADNARVDSEVEMMRSPATLLDVIAQKNLLADPEFGVRRSLADRALAWLGRTDTVSTTADQALQDTLSRLEDAVTVQRRGATYLIAVTVRSTDPLRAADLANAIPEAYIDEQRRAKVERALATAEIMESRARQARSHLVRAEEEFDAFITTSIGTLAADRNSTTAALERSPELLGRGDIALSHENLQQLTATLENDALEGLDHDVSAQFYALQQSAALARSQYQALLARTGELQMQAELQIADSRIVSPALPAHRPTFPNNGLILALAGLGGLGLGIALAFAKETFIGGFTSEHQLGTVSRTEVITRIPHVGPVPPGSSTLADLMTTAPLSPFAESIRRARASIDYAFKATEKRGDDALQPQGYVVLVSSAAPNEGKTTFALALSRAYALSKQKTLVIDCDLRKPSIHNHLGVEPQAGLYEFLAGGERDDNLSSIVLRDEETGLDALVGARRPDMPTDHLLTGATFSRLIDAARRNFDVVILDSPPILALVDGLPLARVADVVALSVRFSSTSQGELRDALSRLQTARPEGASIVTALNFAQGAGLSDCERRYYDYASA